MLAHFNYEFAIAPILQNIEKNNHNIKVTTLLKGVVLI